MEGLLFVLEPVRDEVVRRVKLVAGARAGAKSLRQKLKEMKSQLANADRKQRRNTSEWNWMAKMTDLEYKAEDAIEDYHVHKIIGPGIAERIEKLIADITDKMKAAGIDESDNNQDGGFVKTSANFDQGDCFVGKDEEENKIVSLLDDEDEEKRVISLWGMAGIGKTTIARHVYHRMMKEEAHNFKSFAWVCVTPQCDYRSVVEDVLRQLIETEVEAEAEGNSEDSKEKRMLKVESLSWRKLINDVRKKQTAQRCLIVLDDVWETCDWDKLGEAFVDPASKSKVLVTTRNQHKARTFGFEKEVALLTQNAGWELLKKKIVVNISDPAVIKIGKELVMKCGRLPLAICVLGGALKHSKDKSVREWELVEEYMETYIHNNNGAKLTKLDKAITLSYSALPYHLKLCFLYLGTLREGESIRVGTLYQMWIAQSIILVENSEVREASLMDIAEQHLEDLASRCLVQVEHDYAVPTKKFKTCKLHDAVRGTCLSLGEEADNLVKFVNYTSGSFSTCLQNALKARTRHLVIFCKTEPQDDGKDAFQGVVEDNCECLRSLRIHNDTIGETRFKFPHEFDIQKFTSLRNLVFHRFKFQKTKTAKEITELVHLKHLCFRSCEIVEGLPPSIIKMHFLETLDLFKSLNVRIPSKLEKKMPPMLKHLLLPHYAIGSKGKLKLDEGLKHLESLMEFNSLVHDFSEDATLQYLERFSAHVHDEASLIKILTAIHRNGNKLVNSIVTVDEGCRITSTAPLVDAFQCQNLSSLGIYIPLEWKLIEDCMKNIKTSNIGCLELLNCIIKEDLMKILGVLPNLVELTLNTRSFIGEAMTCHELSFKRLNILKLWRLPMFSTWGVGQGAMGKLSELDIRDCPALEIFPAELPNVSELRKVVMIGVPKFTSKVLKMRGKFHEDCRFISNITPTRILLTRSLQIQAQRFSQPHEEEIAEPTQLEAQQINQPQEEFAEPTQFHGTLEEKS